jgi:hypothetical protein
MKYIEDQKYNLALVLFIYLFIFLFVLSSQKGGLNLKRKHKIYFKLNTTKRKQQKNNNNDLYTLSKMHSIWLTLTYNL